MRLCAPFLLLMAALVVEIASCGGTRAQITVNVSSSSATVPVNGNAFFSASVMNSSNQNVTWAVVGGAANGSISSAGLYTAPATVPANPQVTVTATSQANPMISGQASVTVTISVSINPPATTLGTLGTTQFSASVQGSSNQSVNWEVNGIQGGNITVGTINSSGLFQAPESVPANPSSGQTTTVSVEAVPQANPSLSASAIVTVTSHNQLGQNLPIALGTSGGNVNDENSTECEGGTLGSLVVRAGTQFILSNNHVLANSDAGSIGDGIIQPGLIDTPSPCVASSGSNVVAKLSQFINIEQPNPPADAAIAQVVSGAVNTSGTIIELGDTTNGSGIPTDEAPAGTTLPVSSLVPNSTAVAKSGRSTGLTCSTIEAVSLNVQVKYNRGIGGPAFTATYHNQISVNGGTFSAAGDSGSLIVSQAGAQPVALLYAGSSTNTVGAPVATVLASLADSSNNPPTFVGPASRNGVVGCTSTGADAFGGTASQSGAAKPTAAELAKADAAKNQKAALLLSDPAVLAVGVDGSLDRPNHAAVIVFVQKGQPLVHPIPHTVGGALTRVVSMETLPAQAAKTGILDRASTAELLKSSRQMQAAPTAEQLAAATVVKDKFSPSLLRQSGILGVGVSASLDNPSDPAIIIYVETGKPHNPIPLEFDGFRVRVKFSSQFRAYGWGHPRR